MKIFDLFRPKASIVSEGGYYKGWQMEERRAFGRLVWANAVELLTDLCNDVTFVSAGRNKPSVFAEFKMFFATYAEQVMHRYYNRGYAVIGYTGSAFVLLNDDDYKQERTGGVVRFVANNPNVEVYVMRSPIFCELEISDKEAARPALELIDNAMNASNTCSARLGTLVVASPQTPNSVPTPMVLTDEQKDKLEKDLQKEYGSLSSQKQIMILKRGMQFQVVNLAGIDARTMEKVKMGVSMIADRLKIPANQIAMLDANSAKTLANGSELREGDFNKYQTFERLLNRTFMQLARECGLNIDYTIYNKPTRQLTQ